MVNIKFKIIYTEDYFHAFMRLNIQISEKVLFNPIIVFPLKLL